MQFSTKDITTVKAPAIIIHGVNCQKAMGSGVAKALYEKWISVRDGYMSLPKNAMKLGSIQMIEVEPNIVVINCFTQHKFGTDGDKYANAESLRECLHKVASYAVDNGNIEIFSPRIGCGLGGLDWETEVLPVFQEIDELYHPIYITICDIN